jgi:hypothetical protein
MGRDINTPVLQYSITTIFNCLSSAIQSIDISRAIQFAAIRSLASLMIVLNPSIDGYGLGLTISCRV